MRIEQDFEKERGGEREKQEMERESNFCFAFFLWRGGQRWEIEAEVTSMFLKNFKP